jgi:hypothetical protein
MKNFKDFVEEVEQIDEVAKGHTIEAHGVKGMKNTPWRKTFKHADHLNDWAEKNDADVHGTRDLEQAKKGNLSPAVREEVEQLDELGYKTLQSYRQGAHTQIQHYKHAGGKDKPEASSVLAKREPGMKTATDKVIKKDKERIASQPKREPQKASSYKALGGRDENSGRSYSEEVEQIDELSKKTLGSYAKKATSSMRGVAVSAELAGALDRDNPQREKYQNRALKRVAGVEKAVDRLAKEEVEQVEEGLKPEHNMRPGWMIKADPVLKAKIAANKAKQKEMKSILGKKLKEESLDEGGYPEVDHMPGRRLSRADTHKVSKYTVATNAKDGHKEHKVKVDASSENHARNLAADHFVKKGLKPRVHFDGVRVVKEEVDLNESAYEKSEENKRSADSAKKQGDMFAHHLHMADHHDNLAEWHASKGRHGEADKHAAKSEEHQELAMKHKK